MSAITELKTLPIADRLQLVEDLWDSIASDQAALPDHPQAVEEVRRRRERFDGDPSSGLTWDQLKKNVRSDHG